MDLPKLILASGSPRRSEILGFVGWDFEKHVAEVDETPIQGEPAELYVERLALEKANAVAGNLGESLVLGADTTVVLDDRIIGKPVDLEDARSMIGQLSGRWHEVITGVALVSVSESETRSVSGIQRTGVKFAQLSESEISYLVENGEPLDKAGAYAVQAQAALFIEEIRGDYWNIVGLPINLVYRLLDEFRRN
jgi:septum formation protein